jgi:hypothetical protein
MVFRDYFNKVNAMTIQETISHQALLSTLWQLIGGCPNRDNSDPPGPWDPMIRRALQYSLWVLGPRLDPWRWQNAVGSETHPLIQAEINPQPLPPRALLFATIAREVADRAMVMQETADAIQGHGEQQRIVVIGDYVSKFVDDICGDDFHVQWPFPVPRLCWLPEEVRGIDLTVAGVQFQRTASETCNGQLAQVFAEAGKRLPKIGLSRLQ